MHFISQFSEPILLISKSFYHIESLQVIINTTNNMTLFYCFFYQYFLSLHNFHCLADKNFFIIDKKVIYYIKDICYCLIFKFWIRKKFFVVIFVIIRLKKKLFIFDWFNLDFTQYCSNFIYCLLSFFIYIKFNSINKNKRYRLFLWFSELNYFLVIFWDKITLMNQCHSRFL